MCHIDLFTTHMTSLSDTRAYTEFTYGTVKAGAEIKFSCGVQP